jgi:hypothetical protein
MDDRTVVLLQEIRDLMQRTVANQEQVLRANDESIRIYRGAAKRQVVTMALIVALMVGWFWLVRQW